MANVEQNETTRVFRMPSSDATAPDLMKSTPLIVPVLSIIKGPQTGNVFELDQPEVTIGRDPSNTIFLNDMTVSRSHAKILRNAASVLIEDLGSMAPGLMAPSSTPRLCTTARPCRSARSR